LELGFAPTGAVPDGDGDGVAVVGASFALGVTPGAVGVVGVVAPGPTPLACGSCAPPVPPGSAFFSGIVVGMVVVALAGVATGVPAFAAGLATKDRWLAGSACVGFFWIACACVLTTAGTGVVAPTGAAPAAAAAAAAGLPAATAGGCTLITLLMTVVLWMLLKMMLFAGGAT